jgi:hypothetical protein
MEVLALFVYYIMMHGNMNIRFIHARQAKEEHIYIRTSNGNCIERLQLSGLTKHAGINN